MTHIGGCHCGNISVQLESDIAPGDFEVRACQCSFCRKHNGTAVADPAGHLTIRVADEAQLNRYTFGLGTAEFLVCQTCGCYTSAVTTGTDDPRAIVIVSILEDAKAFTSPPIPVDYDNEDRDGRIGRRKDRWMPVEVVVAG